jgi:hypothetical protein
LLGRCCTTWASPPATAGEDNHFHLLFSNSVGQLGSARWFFCFVG